jgi:cytochrome c oxidase cbb3-type subunit I
VNRTDMSPNESGTRLAVRHSLGWLAFGNAVGLYLALLLLEPGLQAGPLTYGRWMPVHLNVQLYGWTSLPLVAWLLSIYQVDSGKFASWSSAAVWAWTAALAVGVFHWLGGVTSGKLFLDWKAGALAAFVAAQVILWMTLAVSWIDRRKAWNRARRIASLAGLLGLALVPAALVFAASPSVYPPIDRTTGGPTGSSLQGSALFVIGLMLLLPRVTARRIGTGKNLILWVFFALSWLVFGVTEAMGGTHYDPHQIFSMLFLLPWVWLLPRDWKGFEWPDGSKVWRWAMFAWWGVLVVTSLAMYQVGVLDRIKFTQALVAHSHLAMAGFTTSFCALLCVLVTRRAIGGAASVVTWHAAALAMIIILAVSGWMEGAHPHWMVETPKWRELGFILRAGCGALMLAVSLHWLWKTKTA